MEIKWSEPQVAFVVAFKKEAQALLERAGQVQRLNHKGFVIYFANYDNCNIIVVVTGVGSKNCEIATALVKNKSPQLTAFINIGFVGSLTDIYDPSQVVQVGAVLDEKGSALSGSAIHRLEGLPIVKLVCSTKPVVSLLGREKLLRDTDGDCVDMESLGFMRALEGFAGKVSLLKVVSDYADEKATDLLLQNSKSYSDELEKALSKLNLSEW